MAADQALCDPDLGSVSKVVAMAAKVAVWGAMAGTSVLLPCTKLLFVDFIEYLANLNLSYWFWR